LNPFAARRDQLINRRGRDQRINGRQRAANGNTTKGRIGFLLKRQGFCRSDTRSIVNVKGDD
jgi:hypothetical protein